MKNPVRLPVLLLLAALASAALAQGGPPPGYPGGPGNFGAPHPERRAPGRDLSPAEREQWREERRQRREAWREMSPEERHQLRRDIRDARQLYPPRPGD